MTETARGTQELKRSRTKRNAFRYCEGELYDYHISKARLAELRAEIFGGTAVFDSAGPVSYGPSDMAQ